MGIDTTRMIQIYAGMVAELLLEYELPGEMMSALIADMRRQLKHNKGYVEDKELRAEQFPPIYILDREIEFGRCFTREVTLEDLDEVYNALQVLSAMIAHDMNCWASQKLCSVESMRLFEECLQLALSFEFAAQDLCDMMIEDRIAGAGWSLGDCIVGLSGLAGWRAGKTEFTPKSSHPANLPALDQMMFILTQEAIRLGVPSGPDWRMGLAANDVPVDPPVDLIEGTKFVCDAYLDFINVKRPLHRAALIAKAAGRMIAVASGGDLPEIEPALAKPLAMMALFESFKYQDMARTA